MLKEIEIIIDNRKFIKDCHLAVFCISKVTGYTMEEVTATIVAASNVNKTEVGKYLEKHSLPKNKRKNLINLINVNNAYGLEHIISYAFIMFNVQDIVNDKLNKKISFDDIFNVMNVVATEYDIYDYTMYTSPIVDDFDPSTYATIATILAQFNSN